MAHADDATDEPTGSGATAPDAGVTRCLDISEDDCPIPREKAAPHPARSFEPLPTRRAHF
jgi:hypothetical protein